MLCFPTKTPFPVLTSVMRATCSYHPILDITATVINAFQNLNLVSADPHAIPVVITATVVAARY